METLKDRINHLLAEMGDNPNSFAVKCEFTQQTVYNWVKGKVRPPDRTLKIIAEKTGCNYEWLVDGVGEMGTLNKNTLHSNILTNEPNVLERILKELEEMRKLFSTALNTNEQLVSMLNQERSKLSGNRLPLVPFLGTIRLPQVA